MSASSDEGPAGSSPAPSPCPMCGQALPTASSARTRHLGRCRKTAQQQLFTWATCRCPCGCQRVYTPVDEELTCLECSSAHEMGWRCSSSAPPQHGGSWK